MGLSCGKKPPLHSLTCQSKLRICTYFVLQKTLHLLHVCGHHINIVVVVFIIIIFINNFNLLYRINEYKCTDLWTDSYIYNVYCKLRLNNTADDNAINIFLYIYTVCVYMYRKHAHMYNVCVCTNLYDLVTLTDSYHVLIKNRTIWPIVHVIVPLQVRITDSICKKKK